LDSKNRNTRVDRQFLADRTLVTVDMLSWLSSVRLPSVTLDDLESHW